MTTTVRAYRIAPLPPLRKGCRVCARCGIEHRGRHAYCQDCRAVLYHERRETGRSKA